MEEILTKLSSYGYIILFFYSLGGGMVALIGAGILSYAGKMDITTCILIAGISNFIGDSILFYFSRYSKKDFMPYLKKQSRNLVLASLLFKKYGSVIILIKKYIYGVKTLVPIAIAFTKYSFAKFSILNFVSSFIWSISIGLLSYYFGEVLKRVVSDFSGYSYVVALIFIIFCLAGFFFFKNTKRRKK